MPTFDDPYSLQRISQNLPEIQKKLRRAAKLRKQEAGLEAMRSQERSLGELAPAAGGGSHYDVPRAYIPNYGGMAQQAIGGLGEIFMGRKADAAEDELNAARNPEIIQGVQQMSQPDTEQVMAGALGIGPASAAASGAAPTPGAPQPSQPPAPGQPPMPNIDIEGMNEQQRAELAKVVQSMIAVGMDDDKIGEYVSRAAEAAKLPPGQQLGQGGSATTLEGIQPPEAPPGAGPGALPQQPQAPAPTEQVMGQALGLDQAQGGLAPDNSPLATDETIRAYLGMIGGPDMKDVIGKKAHVSQRYVDGDGNLRIIMSDGEERIMGKSNLPVGTVVDAQGNILQHGKTSAQGTGTTQLTGPDGRPLRELTPGEQQTQKTTAQIEAEAALAAQSARTEELKTEGKKMGEVRAEARAKLPGLRVAHAQLDRAANDLLKMPGLDRIFGGSWMGALPDEGVLADIAQGGQSLADPDAADAFAKWQGLKGKIYSGAFETLRGGGQITERETQRVADAYAAMSRKQTPAQFKKSMQEMLLAYREGVAKMEAAASGGLNPGDEVPAAAAPSDPRAKLRSKYGL